MGITFAYELGLKSFIYEKSSTRKVTSDGDSLWPVCKFVESSNSKRKKRYGQISVFLKKLVKSGQTTYSTSINVTT